MTIPTSLIVVLLVVAWLVILVPMAARRREKVPEAEPDGARFRVLRRVSVRRRPRFLHRANDGEEPMDPDGEQADGAADQERARDAAEDWDLAHRSGPGRRRAENGGTEGGMDGPGAGYEAWDDAAGDLQGDAEGDSEYGADDRPDYRPDGGAAEDEADEDEEGEDDLRRAGFDEMQSVFDGEESVRRAEAAYGRSGSGREWAGDDDALRSARRRSGRGGFDPRAAEMASAYRYVQRRRTVMILSALIVLCVVAAVLVTSIMWTAAAVVAVLLVAYLAYLRRQVRIEREVHRRRTARLARARQIRPEYQPQPRQVRGPGAVAVSQVPPVAQGRGRVVVELDDDDPSFDELDEYQPVQYRRAVGQ